MLSDFSRITMSQHRLSSTGCWLARCQSSPATQFVRQYRRTLTSPSAPAVTAELPRSYGTAPSIPRFLLPSGYSQPARPHGLPPHPQVLALRYRGSQLARFSASSANKATTVSLNPRVDDDGNQMMVKISPRAAKRLRAITSPSSSNTSSLSKEGSYDHLRVTVSSGGCHGFQYIMSLDPASKIDQEEDTVFEADLQDSESASSSDQAATGEAKVVMDSASLEILQGSTVDYTVELIGSQFKIVDNPRASSNCGCGTSFDVQ